MREPSPRTMNTGSPPTDRKARTGLFTPPGIRLTALSISLAERSMTSIVLASTLSFLPCKRASPLRYVSVRSLLLRTGTGRDIAYPEWKTGGLPRPPSATPVRANPAEDQQSSNGHEDCTHNGPERLSSHEASGQDADTLQQPDAAHEGYQPSHD